MYNQKIKKLKFSIKVFVGLLGIGLSFVSCQKDEEPMVESSTSSMEAYSLLDIVIVNSENGIPRKPENLNLLKEYLYLNGDGTFSFSKTNGNVENGSWYYEGKDMFFGAFSVSGFEAMIGNKDENGLKLTQEYGSVDGFSEGTVYYTFEKVKQ
jgi:hypothetical protein